MWGVVTDPTNPRWKYLVCTRAAGADSQRATKFLDPNAQMLLRRHGWRLLAAYVEGMYLDLEAPS